MDNFAGDRYFKLNKTLLRAVGLWPFSTTPLTPVKVIIFRILLLSGLAVKLAFFINIKFELYHIFRNLSETVLFMTFVIKYMVFSSELKTAQFREIVLQVRRHWDNLSDANEIKIFQRHASVAQFHAKIFTMFAYPAVVCVIMGHLGPSILKTVMLRNISNSDEIIFKLEYFIDPEKYFYFILFHFTLVLVVGMTVFISTEAMCITLLQHALGLINVASYQMSEGMNGNSLNTRRSKRCFSIYERMIKAVDTQQSAIGFVEHLISVSISYYSVLLLLAMVSLTTSLLRLSYGVSVSHDGFEIMISTIFLIGQLGILFYINYMAQKLIDEDSNFYRVSCDINWYEMQLPNQKLLILILQRGCKPFSISVYGVYEPSIASFSTYVKLSWTYFMMFKSLQ